MVVAGHADLDRAVGERLGDARVVGGDDDFAGAGKQGPLRDVDDHRHAGNRQQRLAGQALRTEPGGNGDYEFQIGSHLGFLLPEYRPSG